MTKGFVLLLCGTPIYIGMRWWQARQHVHLELPELAQEAHEHAR